MSILALAIAVHAILLPPSDYFHEPSIPVITKQFPADMANTACHMLFHDTTYFSVDGCALIKDGKCYVIYPLPDAVYQQSDVDAILEHEKYGHCNGLVHGVGSQGWFTRDGKPAT